MAVSKVGLGWPVGERNFDTLSAWLSALGAGAQEAHCKGDLGAGPVVINAQPTGTILIRGDVQYTGGNHTSLATLNGRLELISTAHFLEVRDLRTISSGANGGIRLLNTNKALRCYSQHSGDPGFTNGIITGQDIEQCVARSTDNAAQFGIRCFTVGGRIKKSVSFGSRRGISLAASNVIASDCFSFSSVLLDYQLLSGATSTNSASQDATGNFTGYTSAELVNFAAGDYRIKSTSDLFALGIGAFFEEGGVTTNDIAISSLAKLPTSSISLNNLKPNYSATISSSAKLPVSSVLLDSVAPEFVLSVISNALLPISSVALDNEAPSNTLSISSSTFLPTSSVSLNNEAPSNSISISSAALLPTSTVLLARDLPVYSSNISSLAKLPTSSVILNDTKPEFSSTVNSFALLPTSVVSLDRVDPSNSISINSFTLLPTSSVVLDKTNPTGITVVSFTPLPISEVVLDVQSVNLVTITSSAKLPTSTVSLDSTVPEYSVQIVGNAPLPTSIVRLSNGNVIYVIGEGNSVTIRSKSNFVQTKSKSNFIKVR